MHQQNEHHEDQQISLAPVAKNKWASAITIQHHVDASLLQRILSKRDILMFHITSSVLSRVPAIRFATSVKTAAELVKTSGEASPSQEKFPDYVTVQIKGEPVQQGTSEDQLNLTPPPLTLQPLKIQTQLCSLLCLRLCFSTTNLQS